MSIVSQNAYKKIHIELFIAIMLFLLGTSINEYSSSNKINNEEIVKDVNNQVSPKTSNYWGPSDVSFIYINNNWTDAKSEFPWVQGGDGTYNNPFFIENVKIDATGSPIGCGILIENSDVYFKIENCTIYNSESSWNNAGIKLSSTKNGMINNSYCINNKKRGILLYTSNNNTISFNVVENNNFMGIDLFSSNNNTILGNTINRNAEHSGLHLDSSHNNSILGNSVNNNIHNGIFIERSDNNTISGNDVNNNEHAGLFLKRSNFSLITGNSFIGNFIGIEQENSCQGNRFENNFIQNREIDDDDDDDDNNGDDSMPGVNLIIIIIIFIICCLIIGGLIIIGGKSEDLDDEPKLDSSGPEKENESEEKYIICDFCGEKIRKGLEKCSYCGSPIKEKKDERLHS
jgi:parallel beta-helix repeat protein